MFRHLATSLCVLVLALPACDDDPVPAPAPRDTGAPSARSPEGEGRPDRAFDPSDVRLDIRPLASGFEQPVGVTHAGDGSGRLYVVEQPGRVRVFKEGAATRLFLDISERVVTGGEQGLLGLAFHPRYEDNGRFFVNYTDRNGDTVVAEYAAARNVGDPGSERVLLRLEQPFDNHNGGHLAFGSDGYLYIATGDGGSAGDPDNNGQRLDTLLGKLLRIDVDARDAGSYGIPDDNPMLDESGARPEIWAFGLRNPWRFSFDRDTDALWIADVGQGGFEEINREPGGSDGGLNYGWRVLEGRACYEDSDCDASGFVPPVVAYSHDFGCAVTGGYVYRGDDFPALQGAYVTGDYCSGNLWAIPANARNVRDPEPALNTGLNISSFGEDESGELYLTDLAGGGVFRVTARARD